MQYSALTFDRKTVDDVQQSAKIVERGPLRATIEVWFTDFILFQLACSQLIILIILNIELDTHVETL